jgi:hypothetical protein
MRPIGAVIQTLAATSIFKGCDHAPFKMLWLLSLAAVGRLSSLDDGFIRRLTDSNWVKLLRRSPGSFVFFHADHARVSDVAYLRFVHAAQRHRNASAFFVASAVAAGGAARHFGIDGYPSLHFAFTENTTTEMLGPFSTDNVARFLAKLTAPKLVTLALDANSGAESVLRAASRHPFDDARVVLLLSDNSTRFGRLSREFGGSIAARCRVASLPQRASGSVFGVRFPSIVVVDPRDGGRFVYSGEPSRAAIASWFAGLPAGKRRELRTAKLFDRSGARKRSTIHFLRRQELGTGELPTFWADPDESGALRSLLGANGAAVCVAADFAEIGICGGPTVPTPPEMFGYAADVDEVGFRTLLGRGGVLVAFDRERSGLAAAARRAARDAVEEGMKVRWAVWDIKWGVPSFRKELKLKLAVPGLWFFPSENLSDADLYTTAAAPARDRLKLQSAASTLARS